MLNFKTDFFEFPIQTKMKNRFSLPPGVEEASFSYQPGIINYPQPFKLIIKERNKWRRIYQFITFIFTFWKDFLMSEWHAKIWINKVTPVSQTHSKVQQRIFFWLPTRYIYLLFFSWTKHFLSLSFSSCCNPSGILLGKPFH